MSGANIAAGFKLNRPEISSNFRMTIVIVPVRSIAGHYTIIVLAAEMACAVRLWPCWSLFAGSNGLILEPGLHCAIRRFRHVDVEYSLFILESSHFNCIAVPDSGFATGFFGDSLDIFNSFVNFRWTRI